MPESVTELGEFCFAECDALKTITIPAGVSVLPNSCFLGSGVQEINLPSRLCDIGANAMDTCTELKSINIPPNVSSIGDNAFADCKKLKLVIVDSEIPPELGKTVFAGCESLEKIGVPGLGYDDYKAAAQWNDYNVYAYNEKCGEEAMAILNADGRLVISGTGAINADAFRDRDDIKSVVIAEEITEIGASAFRNCSSIESFELPDSLVKLGEFAFADCKGVKRLELSAGITEIPKCCFTGCGLNAVKLPASLTKIGDEAFDSCVSLENIRIPENVAFIGEGAFEDCKKLEAVICEAQKPPVLGENVFEGCGALDSVGVPTDGAKEYNKTEQWNAFKIIPFVSSNAVSGTIGNGWLVAALVLVFAACGTFITLYTKKKKARQED